MKKNNYKLRVEPIDWFSEYRGLGLAIALPIFILIGITIVASIILYILNIY